MSRSTISDRSDQSGVERREFGVDGRGTVVSHRVHGVFQIVEVGPEQRDPPFSIVKPGRCGDQLNDATRELAPRGAVLVHEFLAFIKGQAIPVLVLVAPFVIG